MATLISLAVSAPSSTMQARSQEQLTGGTQQSVTFRIESYRTIIPAVLAPVLAFDDALNPASDLEPDFMSENGRRSGLFSGLRLSSD
jgi:hypothetical protein